MGGAEAGEGRYVGYGLLGGALPLFRVREPLAGRLLGSSMQDLGQRRWDQALDTNLDQRAKVDATNYCSNVRSEFEERAFRAFASKCRDRHSRLVICCGQLNPILEKSLDPRLRPEMLSFLREMAVEDSNITLLDESSLPRQDAQNYDDLTHVNAAAREQFSEFIAGVLDNLVHNRPALPAALH